MSTKYIIPQQSLNMLRQCLNVAGWAKTTSDLFCAGRLLAERLQVLDLSWVKSPEEIAALTPGARKLYADADRAFGELEVIVELDDKDREVIRRCLDANVSKIPPDLFSYKLFKAFGLE